MQSEKLQITTGEDCSSQDNRVWIIFFLFCITFLAYINTLSNDWVWDDVSSVLIHKHVQDPTQFFQLFREDQHAFGRGQGNFYRPLVSVSFMIDYLNSADESTFSDKKALPNLSPFLFHVTNILLHALVGICMFLLLIKLQTPFWPAFWACTIFCIHPLHTEAVAYISGRADMMSGLFMLLSLLCAIYAIEVTQTTIFIVSTALSILCFICGLLSKESTNIYPVLLILIFLLYPSPTVSDTSTHHFLSFSKLFRKGILLSLTAIVIAIYIYLRLTVLNFAHKSVTLDKSWTTKFIEIGQAFAFYIRALFVPIHLHMEQTLENTPKWTSFIGYGLLLLFGILLFGAYVHKQKRIFLGASWFIACWFPISGFFTLNAPQAEHWMYVPMIGFWWFVVEIIYLLLNSLKFESNLKGSLRAGVTTALILVVCMYFIATFTRNYDWKDNETIFRDTLMHNPNSTRVRFNLAVTYEEITHNLPGAIREYSELLKIYDRLKPSKASQQKSFSFLNEEEIEAQLSLGKTLFRTGQFAKAIEKLTPVSLLVQHREFLPYGYEALWFVAQSYLAYGDVKTYQIITAKLGQVDPILANSIVNVALGKPISVPAYMAYEN